MNTHAFTGAMLATTAAILTGCAAARHDASAGGASGAEQAVSNVLDALHRAAATANEDVYFKLFAPDAVFLGTDATERWPIAEFQAWAMPYFRRDSAWVYRVLERHIDVAPGGRTAWFDERLWNDRLGETRGSGVLRLIGGAWRIEQYNLTMLIPNDLADDVAAQVKAWSATQP